MTGLFWKATLSAVKSTHDVNERQTVTLKWKTNYGLGTIKLIHNDNNRSIDDNSKYKMRRTDKEISLEINCVNEADGGNYVCEMHTFLRVSRSPAITLNVVNILHYPKKEYMAQARRAITLSCEVKKSDSTVVYWTHNSSEIDTKNKSKKYKVSAMPFPSLKICSVNDKDAGRYECRVKELENPCPSTTENSICLELIPEVVISSERYVAQIHSEVRFHCDVYGADDCTWKHDDKVISTGNIRYQVNDDMSLTISPVEQSDAGRYVCEIENFSKTKKVTSLEIFLETKPPITFQCFPEHSDASEILVRESKEIENLSAKIPDDKACIWFIGHYGAGKSSTISSFQSWSNDRITTVALPGGGQTSFTTEVSSSEILGGKVKLYDFPGFEGSTTFDSKYFRYKHFDDITKDMSESNPLKCCVVYVIDCSSEITEEDVERMNQFNEYIKGKGYLQMLILLTKIDKASKNATTVQDMLKSREVCRAIEQIKEAVGLPLQCIFAFCNYHHQLDLDTGINLLIVRTVRCLLERILDIYERLKLQKVVTT